MTSAMDGDGWETRSTSSSNRLPMTHREDSLGRFVGNIRWEDLLGFVGNTCWEDLLRIFMFGIWMPQT